MKKNNRFVWNETDIEISRSDLTKGQQPEIIDINEGEKYGED